MGFIKIENATHVSNRGEGICLFFMVLFDGCKKPFDFGRSNVQTIQHGLEDCVYVLNQIRSETQMIIIFKIIFYLKRRRSNVPLTRF